MPHTFAGGAFFWASIWSSRPLQRQSEKSNPVLLEQSRHLPAPPVESRKPTCDSELQLLSQAYSCTIIHIRTVTVPRILYAFFAARLLWAPPFVCRKSFAHIICSRFRLLAILDYAVDRLASPNPFANFGSGVAG